MQPFSWTRAPTRGTGRLTFTTDAGSDVTITDNSAFAIQSGLTREQPLDHCDGSGNGLGRHCDVDGTLTVIADDGQTIDLSGGGSNRGCVTGAVTLTGAAVTLADTTATSIAGITATGALTLTSGGAITQSGAIDADSTASVTAGANAPHFDERGAMTSFGAVSLSNSGKQRRPD